MHVEDYDTTLKRNWNISNIHVFIYILFSHSLSFAIKVFFLIIGKKNNNVIGNMTKESSKDVLISVKRLTFPQLSN